MTSITRKLHFYMLRKKIGGYVLFDLFLFAAASFAFLAGAEYEALGHFELKLERNFMNPVNFRYLYYLVNGSDGSEILKINVLPPLRILIIAVMVIFALQIAGLLLGYGSEHKKIQKILSPINAIAIEADRLSRLSFSEEKYHLLEDAIDKINPDDAEKLSFGDEDLVGVEAAMNNLLIRVRDSYRQQARFVNDASHELRTPIAVIQGYANMLDRWGKEDRKILDESIAAIRNESDHMNHLVDQLHFLARGDSGKTVVRKEQVDLAAMVQEVYEESFMIDEQHPYRLRPPKISGADESADVSALMTTEADAGLLKQAMRILVDNAAKYTKEGDEILLSSGVLEDGSHYLEVQDTGIGMAEADVQHMFERFYRSDEVRSYQGTGLGLSIAKWIVDKHGGHFEILSRTSLGTRIRIVLP